MTMTAMTTTSTTAEVAPVWFPRERTKTQIAKNTARYQGLVVEADYWMDQAFKGTDQKKLDHWIEVSITMSICALYAEQGATRHYITEVGRRRLGKEEWDSLMRLW